MLRIATLSLCLALLAQTCFGAAVASQSLEPSNVILGDELGTSGVLADNSAESTQVLLEDGGDAVNLNEAPVELSNAPKDEPTVPLRGLKTLVTGAALLLFFVLLFVVKKPKGYAYTAIEELFKGTLVERAALAVIPTDAEVDVAFVWLGVTFTLIISGLFELIYSASKRLSAQRQGAAASSYPIRGVVPLVLAFVVIAVSVKRILSSPHEYFDGDLDFSVGLGVGVAGLLLLLQSATQRFLFTPRKQLNVRIDQIHTDSPPAAKDSDVSAVELDGLSANQRLQDISSQNAAGDAVYDRAFGDSHVSSE